jgi:hypothetical protein
MTLSFENLKETQGRFEIKIKSPDLKKACKELERFFKKEYDKEDLDDCYVCGYQSPDEDFDGNLIEHCPYCGVEFDYDEEEEEEEYNGDSEVEALDMISPDILEEDEEDEKESNDSPLEDSEEEENSKLELEEEKESEKENEETTEKDMGENNSDLKEVVERVTKKKEKETLPIVHDEVLSLNQDQEEELNNAIEKIKSIKTGIVENIYNVGVCLSEIHDNMLWKAKSPNFNKFCEEYLDISRSSVYKYMNCVSKFTKEQFLKLGIKKGDLISRLPEGKRDEVAEIVIKNNMTAEATKNFIQKEKIPPKEKNEKRKQEKEEVKDIKEDTITILSKLKENNELEVPWILFDGESLVEERTSNDKYAIVDISNEVELILIENEFGTGLICSFRTKK